LYDWRHATTGQRLQSTSVAKPEVDAARLDTSSKALEDKEILQAPVQGWDDLGTKPGWFGDKALKKAYRQKKKERDEVVDKAWKAMGRDQMPNFIADSPDGRKKWFSRMQSQNRANLFMPLPKDGR
jgi:hypothetical protein